MGVLNLLIDDVEPQEWTQNPQEKVDKAFVITDEQIDQSIESIEVNALLKKCERALSKAMQLRGLTKAINDPIALAGERRKWREEYREIEVEIRETWIELTDYLEK